MKIGDPRLYCFSKALYKDLATLNKAMLLIEEIVHKTNHAKLNNIKILWEKDAVSDS